MYQSIGMSHRIHLHADYHQIENICNFEIKPLKFKFLKDYLIAKVLHSEFPPYSFRLDLSCWLNLWTDICCDISG